MLSIATLQLVLIGFVVGIVVISMGGGGAAIYLGVLTTVAHLNPQIAATTSLVTALPSLMIGAGSYLYRGKVNLKVGNQMLLTALPAVIVGSLLAPYIPQTFYRWVVGLILILLGVQMFFQKSNKTSEVIESHNTLKASGFGIISGLMVGVAGLSGGGPVLAGLLLLGLDTFTATATSTYVLVGTGVVGMFFHLTTSSVDWNAGLGLMAGALIGAVAAPFLMNKLSQRNNRNGTHRSIFKPLMAILLIFMGIRTIASF